MIENGKLLLEKYNVSVTEYPMLDNQWLMKNC